MTSLAAALALTVAAAAAVDPAPVVPPRSAESSPPARTYVVAGVGSSSMHGRGPKRAPFLTVLVGSLGAPWRAFNVGESGIHAAGCLDRWRSKVRGRGFGSLVVMCGLNDIRSGSTAEGTWSTLRVLLDEAVADGLRVIPMTLQPFRGDRAWAPEKHAQLLALNAEILAWCEAQRVTCVDAYGALEEPGTGAMQARYDCGDHLHMSQAAHDLLARKARPAFP